MLRRRDGAGSGGTDDFGDNHLEIDTLGIRGRVGNAECRYGLTLRDHDPDVIDHVIDLADGFQDLQNVSSLVSESDRAMNIYRAIANDELQPDRVETAAGERPTDLTGQASVACCRPLVLSAEFGGLGHVQEL